jgi:predicted amidohydrolase
MSTRTITVSALQPYAHDRDGFAERWPSLLARVTAAADNGARLIVVPEGTVPGYVIGTEPVDPQVIESALNDVIRIAAASGATIVYGTARAGEQGLANSAYVVTGDGVRGFADKCFLWHFDRRWFTAGSALAPIDTPAGRLGVFICADGRLPTIGASLAAQGAEILVVPTAWVTSGRDPAQLENIQADLFAPVRARENGLPMVVANKAGVEARSVLYCGKSQIIDARGNVLVKAGQDEETTISAEVEIGAAAARTAMPNVERGTGAPLPAATRIAFTAQNDAHLATLASLADASLVIDGERADASSDLVFADDAAMLDPRALVEPRLAGARIVVWKAGIEPAWIVPFARTRAAELRCYVLVLGNAGARSFVVDPDGVILAGTFGEFVMPAFAYDRARTEAWTVAPFTNVRDGLARVTAIEASRA